MNRIEFGDCRDTMRRWAEQGVKAQMCVTSPPYFGLRSYLPDDSPDKPLEIGLEETPEQYVARMVEVFRCVWDVLADDGTLFVNIGDSYNAAGRTGHGTRVGYKQGTNRASATGADNCHPNVEGLKPKDLIGIPWMLAFAMRQPWYSGRITKEIDRMWLAAMIDGEGCMFIHKRKAGTDSGAKFTKADGTEVSYARKQDTYSPGLEVANTHLGIVERCRQITGLGSITRQDKDRRLPLYRWHLRADEARQIVREVYPYLIGKRQQGRILCGCPTSGEQADAAHQALMLLHNGALTDVDFKDPASMHEQGWYLRQDVIWSKPNPIPESVRDRCTKAHEYVFLLSKSERYFFDSEAMKEPATNAGKRVSLGEKSFSKGQGKGAGVAASGNGLADFYDVPETRNRRSVWTVATRPYKGAHFATFPADLIIPTILAGTSERGHCPECGARWVREVVKTDMVDTSARGSRFDAGKTAGRTGGDRTQAGDRFRSMATGAWLPTCSCGHDPVPDIVLDPFMGSGTTAAVALQHGRQYLGCELNPDYGPLQQQRIDDTLAALQAPPAKPRKPRAARTAPEAQQALFA